MAQTINYYLGTELIAQSPAPADGKVKIPEAANAGYYIPQDPSENPVDRGLTTAVRVESGAFGNFEARIAPKLGDYGSLTVATGKQVTLVTQWSTEIAASILLEALKKAEFPHLTVGEEGTAPTAIGISNIALATRGGTLDLLRSIDKVAAEKGFTTPATPRV